ncbi:MAG TPA: ECF-type sigma factor, partial [Candidatus Angelobacter sp.]|nr:ECF-type sigma factor [Candidatus Angelobacter sp.]
MVSRPVFSRFYVEAKEYCSLGLMRSIGAKIIRKPKKFSFFGATVKIVIPRSRMTEKPSRPFTCPNGHPIVAIGAKCSICGASLEHSVAKTEEQSAVAKPSLAPASKAEPDSIVVLFQAIQQGNTHAETQLILLVDSEIKRLARYYIRGERAGHSFQTADLVQEYYIQLLRLTQDPETVCESRQQFLIMAARMMRHILVDRARKRDAGKRGGPARTI